jgi:hypothetical protein
LIHLVVAFTLSLAIGSSAWAGGAVEELSEAEVYIEWNSTDTDFGIQFFWDSGGFTTMKVRNAQGGSVLDVKTKKNVRDQGLTEGFFESVEPPSSELPMDAFLERFPEGEYTFKGKSINGGWLVGETDFTHILPLPLENMFPGDDEVVSHLGFTVSFDPVTHDIDGNPLDPESYEVVFEKEDDDPILRTYKVILAPSANPSVHVPAEFLEPDTEYKLEVVTQEESGNRTITETTRIFTTSQ